VISGSLKNVIGDHLSKLQHVPAKFYCFWRFRQNLVTEKLKGSLIAPVLMNSKCVTGSLWQSFRHSSVMLIDNVDFADRQWRLSK